MLIIKIPAKKFDQRLTHVVKRKVKRELWLCALMESLDGIGWYLFYNQHLDVENVSRLSSLSRMLEPVLIELTTTLNNRIKNSFLAELKSSPANLGLIFVTGKNQLTVYYHYLPNSTIDPVILSIPGPSMETLQVLPLFSQKVINLKNQQDSIKYDTQRHKLNVPDNSFSELDRFACAIGYGNINKGFELLSKAHGLVIGFIGLGKLGSWQILRLCKEGVGSKGGFILIDPDIVEESNLDGMAVPREAVGHPKVNAVAGTAYALTRFNRFCCFQSTISDPEVTEALKTVDIIFTNVDEPSVRLAAATLASRFHIPHFDATAGMAWANDRKAVAGGELRIFVPGNQGCLACFDEYNWQASIDLLELNLEQELQRRQKIAWYDQRPGSNADILWAVASESLQAFWALLRGDIKDSLWWHYEKDSSLRPKWSDWSNKSSVLEQRKKCVICGNTAGLGEIIK